MEDGDTSGFMWTACKRTVPEVSLIKEESSLQHSKRSPHHDVSSNFIRETPISARGFRHSEISNDYKDASSNGSSNGFHQSRDESPKIYYEDGDLALKMDTLKYELVSIKKDINFSLSQMKLDNIKMEDNFLTNFIEFKTDMYSMVKELNQSIIERIDNCLKTERKSVSKELRDLREQQDRLLKENDATLKHMVEELKKQQGERKVNMEDKQVQCELVKEDKAVQVEIQSLVKEMRPTSKHEENDDSDSGEHYQEPRQRSSHPPKHIARIDTIDRYEENGKNAGRRPPVNPSRPRARLQETSRPIEYDLVIPDGRNAPEYDNERGSPVNGHPTRDLDKWYHERDLPFQNMERDLDYSERDSPLGEQARHVASEECYYERPRGNTYPAHYGRRRQTRADGGPRRYQLPCHSEQSMLNNQVLTRYLRPEQLQELRRTPQPPRLPPPPDDLLVTGNVSFARFAVRYPAERMGHGGRMGQRETQYGQYGEEEREWDDGDDSEHALGRPCPPSQRMLNMTAIMNQPKLT